MRDISGDLDSNPLADQNSGMIDYVKIDVDAIAQEIAGMADEIERYHLHVDDDIFDDLIVAEEGPAQ